MRGVDILGYQIKNHCDTEKNSLVKTNLYKFRYFTNPNTFPHVTLLRQKLNWPGLAPTAVRHGMSITELLQILIDS